ncbi:MAG: hypothetical protein CMK09_05840 [Ponticaulis sp.]|nr:hypothetical protein [Ponticaulis sp.]|tara:strand:- start:61813 stop:62121 length:309 start_codon:yes stop_codon:yes gene_type:complete
MNKYIMLLGIVIAGFLAVGMFQAKSGAGDSRHRIERLESEIADIRSDIDRLEKQYESLTSPARIADLASEHLDMHPARSSQMISLEGADAYFGSLKSREEAE